MNLVDALYWINGAFKGALTWTPTANHIIALPNATGTVLLNTTVVPVAEPRAATLRLGTGAGVSNTSGSGWIAIGTNAGTVNNAGEWTAIGAYAGQNNTTGQRWIAIGINAGADNISGGNWAAIGPYAGQRNIGSFWTAIGPYAGQNSTLGEGWTAIAYGAGSQNTTGFDWTAIGTSAGGSSTTGSNWTAIGTNALMDATTASNNTAIGRNTGRGITTGGGNTIVGANIGGLPSALSNNVILASGDGAIKFQIDASGIATLTATPSTGDSSLKVATTAFVENTAVARVDNLSKVRYLFVPFGESNSGGCGSNSILTAIDLLPQNHLKIWNNSTSTFQALQIGTNNLISHTGLTDNTTHGIERGLAREVLNTLQWPEAYILKAGQGGSTIAQWSVGNASGYLSTLTSRYNAARSALTSQGFIVRPVVLWFNGINDAIAGTNPTTWRTATQAHFAQIRSLMGATTPIFMPQIMPTNAAYTAINTEIATIDAADVNMWALATVNVASNPSDPNHYTPNGYLQIARAFVDSFRSNLGVPGTFSIGQARTASSNPIVTLKRNTAQTISATTYTQISLNTVEIDTDNLFNSTNGTVVIASGAEGAYLITGMVTTNVAKEVRALIYINGVARSQSPLQIAATDIVYSGETTRTFRLNVGDIISLYCYQTNSTNATKDLFIQTEHQACLQMTRTGV